MTTPERDPSDAAEAVVSQWVQGMSAADEISSRGRARLQNLIAAALQAERDRVLRECRGIIGRHKRYWEDADAEIADLQKRIRALKGKP